MDVTATLLKFIQTELLNDLTTLNADDNLLADGMVSSIGMLRLVTFIEESYSIKIPFEDLIIENFRTTGIISSYLQNLLTVKD